MLIFLVLFCLEMILSFTTFVGLKNRKDRNIRDQGKKDPAYISKRFLNWKNEMLHIMASQVLRNELANILKYQFFSMILDEYTDVSNVEQLSFCLRTVDEKLNVREDFLGFYELDNIRSSTIVNAIKDILHRFNLNLEDCRGQTYDGASNMLGQHSSVVTQILADELKAVVRHCHSYSLSLLNLLPVTVTFLRIS